MIEVRGRLREWSKSYVWIKISKKDLDKAGYEIGDTVRVIVFPSR